MSKRERIVRRQDDYEINEQISLATATRNDEPSKTLQGPAHDADINNIAKMYGLTQFSKMPLPPEAADPRYYGDLSDAPMDLQTAFDRVFQAQEHFDRLPADLRAKFNHSPAVLWDWLQDPGHHKEAVDLGILFKQPDPPVVPPEAGS